LPPPVPHTPALVDLIDALDKRPTIAEYQAVARALDDHRGDLRPCRVALLASFTIDPLVPFLRVEAARLGFDADVYVGPFNAVHQELLDPQSGCGRRQPDIVFITQLLADVCPALSDDFLAQPPQAVDQLIDETIATCMNTIRAYRERSSATVVLSNFGMPAAPVLGIFEAMAEGSQTAAIRRLNTRLVESARTLPGLYVQDVDRLAAQVGQSRWYDMRMWCLARAPLSGHALPALAALHAAFIHAAFGPPRKCLVVDLDHTLWGGVLGEDGIHGIALGQSYPGNAFRRFQQAVLALSHRGILLAINSKNNPDEVLEVLRSHPDMVLKAHHFSAMQINWRDKADNMLAIADALAIGVDSLVFFDDSPAECALMRRLRPEILTIQAPKDVLDYPGALARSCAFEQLSITAEDVRRREIYRDEERRRQHRASAASMGAFLESLQMAAEIRPIDRFSLPRAVELTQKTNQFNLTTRRYAAAEIATAAEAGDGAAFSLRLVDRFGDHGIVGLAIVRVDRSVADIETFLLSCRVIGRSAETALLSFLVGWARSRRLEGVEGEFVPTRKNAPAADFYARHGFSPAGQTGRGTRWRLSTTDADVSWPACIRAVQPA
jgi:FkbH-like protein